MWPKGPYRWVENGTLYVSVPFTWNLPAVKVELLQRDWRWERAVVGGPAVDLMPDYLSGLEWVTVGCEIPGVLQRINPLATRTTVGCPNHCAFCGIGQGKIEAGGFRELDDWPNQPVLCDNNILAASERHLERVVERLEVWGRCDFNQGLDVRLMTPEKAALIARIKEPKCRLALDDWKTRDQFAAAVDMLRTAGVAKKHIATLALIGFKTGRSEAWQRLLWLENEMRLAPSPLWYHPLDAMDWNGITSQQRALGWSDEARVRIMRYFYKRCGSVPEYALAPVASLREKEFPH